MKRCLSLTLAALPGFVMPILASETIVDGSTYPDLFGPGDSVVNVVHPPTPSGAVAQLILTGSGSGALGTHWTAQVSGGAKIGTNLIGEVVLASTGAQAALTGSALQFNLSNDPEELLSALGVGSGLSLTWSATAKFDDTGGELNLAPNSVYDVSFDVVDGSGLLNSLLAISPTFGVELLDGANVPIGFSGGGTLANVIGLELEEVAGAPEGTGRATARFRTGASVSALPASVRFTASAVVPASIGNIATNFATISNLTVDQIDPYTVWLEDNEVSESMQDPNADPDSDGKPNSQEYALATDPNSGGHDDVDYVIADPDAGGAQTSAFIMTIPVRSGAQFSADGGDQVASQDGASYRVEGSYDLQTWTLAVSEVTPNQAFSAGLPTLPSGWEYRSFRLPDQTQNERKAFLRVKFD
jgi:hypothetical protein